MLRSPIPESIRPEVAPPLHREARLAPLPARGCDVVLIGSSHDLTLNYFARFCRAKRVRLAHLRLETLRWNRRALQRLISRSTGVYFRPLKVADRASMMLTQAVRYLLSSHPNALAPSPRSANWSKPLQMSTSIAAGSSHAVRAVPTVLSNRTRPRDHGHIVKSLSSVRSTVVSCDDPRLPWTQPRAAYLKCQPLQFQPRLTGTNLRVHVVGNETFTLGIRAESVDYRAGSQLRTWTATLPKGVSAWCVDAAKREGLILAGIDLVRTARREFYCFEINPMPGYHAFEDGAFGNTQPISSAILSVLLARGTSREDLRTHVESSALA
jgi:hypothetical protein